MYNATISDLSGALLASASGDLLAVVKALALQVPEMATYKKVWREMQRVDGVFASYFTAPLLSSKPVLVQIVWTDLTP